MTFRSITYMFYRRMDRHCYLAATSPAWDGWLDWFMNYVVKNVSQLGDPQGRRWHKAAPSCNESTVIIYSSAHFVETIYDF